MAKWVNNCLALIYYNDISLAIGNFVHLWLRLNFFRDEPQLHVNYRKRRKTLKSSVLKKYHWNSKSHNFQVFFLRCCIKYKIKLRNTDYPTNGFQLPKFWNTICYLALKRTTKLHTIVSCCVFLSIQIRLILHKKLIVIMCGRIES